MSLPHYRNPQEIIHKRIVDAYEAKLKAYEFILTKDHLLFVKQQNEIIDLKIEIKVLTDENTRLGEASYHAETWEGWYKDEIKDLEADILRLHQHLRQLSRPSNDD